MAQSHLRYGIALPVAVVAAQLRPKMIPVGVAEIVWNQTSDACPGFNQFGHIGEQPDSMPDAWHNPLTNQTSFISATDWGTFATVGPSLNDLVKHDCSHRVYTSINSSLPWDMASHQWLQSSFMFPNGSGAALIHSEFHGGMTGDKSLCSVQHNQGNCQWWSTGLGVTSNGGDTWELVSDPPTHFTFAPPHRFQKDSDLTGFGAIGGLALDEDSGFFYSHVNQIRASPDPSDTSSSGVCAFRTNDIFNPRAFRGWNGSAWATTWVNPYTASPEDLATGDHTCAVVDTGFPHNGHPNMRKFAGDWRPEGWPSHLMLGWPEAGRGNKLAYAYPAWAAGSETNFAEWTDANYVDITGWLDPEIFGAASLMYPALFDADSPFKLGQFSAAGLSYSLLGNESAYVYFVIGRRYIARLPVAFFPEDTPDPPVPFPPAPPPSLNPDDCIEFAVAGAGQADVNGVYSKTGKTSGSSNLPVFQKDGSHQLYSFQKQWKLEQFGVGPAYYATARSSKAAVPVNGWGAGVKPSPTVTCVNPVTCSKFSVTGAGQPDVNGFYVKTRKVSSSGAPIFEKDGSHQLYQFQNRWKLAYYDVGPVYYYTATSNDAIVPVTGWGSGVAPDPVVMCVETEATLV